MTIFTLDNYIVQNNQLMHITRNICLYSALDQLRFSSSICFIISFFRFCWLSTYEFVFTHSVSLLTYLPILLAPAQRLLMHMRAQEEKLQILSMHLIAERSFSLVMLLKLSIWTSIKWAFFFNQNVNLHQMKHGVAIRSGHVLDFHQMNLFL